MRWANAIAWLVSHEAGTGQPRVLDGERAAAHPSTRAERALPGAGDAFAAVLLISLVHGQDLQDALAAACEAGARVAANGS